MIRRRITPRATAALLIVLGAGPWLHSPACAQESTNVTSATLPSPGVAAVRVLWRTTVFDDPRTAPFARKGREHALDTRLAIGLLPELSAEARLVTSVDDLDATAATPAGSDHAGLSDLELSVKWRIWRSDPGAVDTQRLALIAGTDLPTGSRRLGGGSFDPFAGIAFTGIAGRFGAGFFAGWQVTTGGHDRPRRAGETTADVFRLDANVLYRLFPQAYTSERIGAWYVTAEVLSTFETNGDAEVMVLPGVLYEGPRWAMECTIGLPVVRDLARRPERDVVITAGVRVLF